MKSSWVFANGLDEYRVPTIGLFFSVSLVKGLRIYNDTGFRIAFRHYIPRS